MEIKAMARVFNGTWAQFININSSYFKKIKSSKDFSKTVESIYRVYDEKYIKRKKLNV